ncbi:MAG TPA: branched-chain amino acid ABC transporter permease [Usitatibacter sp.]|jgi:branched-chain amino acid transport system permease protein|nr:branched-chain amino acid ABC transporter permease [Usitatibacter sp.]
MFDNLQILTTAPVFNLQLLLNGISIAAIFALIAYGLGLVWGVTSVKNLSQGDMVMMGGYLAYLLHNHGVHPIVAIVPVAIIMFAFGWIIYRLIIKRVIELDLFTSLLATFGLAIVIQQALNLAFGPDVRTIKSGFGNYSFFDGTVDITQIRLIAIGLCIALAIAMVLFLRFSRMGQAIRATAQDPRAARVLGVDTDTVYALTFSLNAAICGAAGVLIAMVWVIAPFYGTAYSIRAFVIVTASGLGNLPGVIFIALALGVIEQYSGFILGAQFQQATIVLLLLAILIFRQLALVRHRRALQ